MAAADTEERAAALDLLHQLLRLAVPATDLESGNAHHAAAVAA